MNSAGAKQCVLQIIHLQDKISVYTDQQSTANPYNRRDYEKPTKQIIANIFFILIIKSLVVLLNKLNCNTGCPNKHGTSVPNSIDRLCYELAL